jgi:hypothetical protein
MVRLRQDGVGNYVARKRLPDDVREEYGRLYGAHHEAKFSAPKSTKSHEAKQRFGEWIAEVEGRIATIRAARDGIGQPLTRHQARALAGEWYEWFTARHAEATTEHLELRRDTVHEAFKSAVTEEEFARLHAEELWDMEEVREAVRPVLADVGETAQFLALKKLR